MKVALVYDRVNKFGGAERILMALHEIWPGAPLFTSVYNPDTAAWAKDFKIISSFLQKFPLAKTGHELYPLLMPMGFESFNFGEYDVVISITSEAAKGIITKPGTLHLCYCLTPTRYLWSGYANYFETEKLRMLSKLPVAYLRKWDKVACQRPDEYIAISKTVQSRIKNYYHRESDIIYPPVDIDTFKIKNTTQSSRFFLVVSRLVKYKKVDLVVEVFNELGWDLKIVGVGREMKNLRGIGQGNIEFLGQLTDSELLTYYQNCQAVIFPQEEDFGIVPLEAMACGKPVIAFKKGGAQETIIDRKTGLFFEGQTRECLTTILKEFERIQFDPFVCRRQAEKFGKEIFKNNFVRFVDQRWQKLFKENTKTTCTL